MKLKKDNITNNEWAYVAGFFDGDGFLMAQIMKSEDYKYLHRIRVSIVFYQKTEKYWFLLWLKKKFKYGYVKKRNDGVSEYVITSAGAVEIVLNGLLPYLQLKRSLAVLILKIIKDKKNISSFDDFLDICDLVDQTKFYSYSKKRLNTRFSVKEFWDEHNKKF